MDNMTKSRKATIPLQPNSAYHKLTLRTLFASPFATSESALRLLGRSLSASMIVSSDIHPNASESKC